MEDLTKGKSKGEYSWVGGTEGEVMQGRKAKEGHVWNEWGISLGELPVFKAAGLTDLSQKGNFKNVR